MDVEKKIKIKIHVLGRTNKNGHEKHFKDAKRKNINQNTIFELVFIRRTIVFCY